MEAISNAIGQKIISQSRLTYSSAGVNGPLESVEKMLVTDLIGEGPIDGVVDKYGSDVSPKKIYVNNDLIYKGIYYNDLAILDTDSDLYNYNLVDSSIKFGYGVQESLKDNETVSAPINDPLFNFSNPAVAYGYEKPLFPVSETFDESYTSSFRINSRNHSSWVLNDNYFSAKDGSYNAVPAYTANAVREKFNRLFTKANFAGCFGVTHEVRDNNTKFLILSFQLNTCYRNDNKRGDTRAYEQYVGISLGYKGDKERVFILHGVSGICTSAYKFDLYLDISDFDMSRIPVVRVYNFSKKLSPTVTKLSRSISFVNVVEMQSSRLTYPYSAYAFHQIDSRSQSQIPNRSYDLRLLKVKVPINYDSESREYFGSWNGEFDPALRWTDNPAWILYDLITNQRYGLGKFTKEFTFLNKWSAYEIAKFCDELVATKLEPKFPPATIVDIIGDRDNLNTIKVDLSAYNVSKAFPVSGRVRRIALMNLKFYDPETGEYYFKSFEGYLSGVTAYNNSVYLAKKMGPSKILSSFDASFGSVSNLDSRTFLETMYMNSGSSYAGQGSTQGIFGTFGSFVKGVSNTSNLNFLDNEDIGFFTPEEKQYYIPNSGKAAVIFDDEGYGELLEPRFNCNIYLTENTQVYDLVNNIASVFRGVAYWNNFKINFAADKKADPVYAFTNANVKNGLFNYSGSSKDNRYTVSKVVYSDKTDNFRDKTIYVEDYTGIREYGYIEREIIGFGITSESQARRIGRWFLLTNQVERDIISFTTGQEAVLVNVGDIISISDQYKLSSPRAGRIHSVQRNGYVLTLDNKYDFIQPNDKITIQVVFKNIEEIKNLNSDAENSGFLYTFTVDEVEIVSSDDDFRTQVTLIVDDSEKRKMFGQLTPNSLWFFEEKYQSDIKYKKDYRVVSIKEGANGEFEINASEYNKSKFDYMEFDNPLDIPALVDDDSNAELEKSDFIPRDLLAYLNGSTVYNPSAQSEASRLNQLIGALVFKNDFKGSYTPNYDYIFEAEFLVEGKYSETFYSVTFTPSTFYSRCCAFDTGPVISASEDAQTIGLLISMSLCGKRVSFRWLKNDAKTSYTIVYPIKFFNDSAIDITVYKIGRDYQLLP